MTTFFLTGLLYDATQHYPNSFYLGGGVTALGALVMVPVAIWFSRTTKSQSEQINEENTKVQA